MNKQELMDALFELIENAPTGEDEIEVDDEGNEVACPGEPASPLCGATYRTFEEAMLLTDDTGFVLKTRDGSKFQVTVREV